MQPIIKKSNCCGCSLCYEICPKNAIEIKPDGFGFNYPNINSDLCVECGLCEGLCVFIKRDEVKRPNSKIVAAKHKTPDVRERSTSGGAFSAFADYIVKNNGVIYGAALCEGRIVKHIRIDDGNYEPLCGSKYVQSDSVDIFQQVQNDLLSEKHVLFTGTPCQCAGLMQYLKFKRIDTTRLVTVDFVCHGVANPKMFAEYICYAEKKSGKKIADHKFRSKLNGWHSHTEVNVFDDGSKDFSTYESQLYKGIFHSHLAQRESCFNCKYASMNRISDITMGDFWGIDKALPDFDDNKGVSLVMINSEKGKDFWNAVSEKFEFCYLSEDSLDQPQLKSPTKKPENYEKYKKDYIKHGFRYTIKKYHAAGTFRRFLSSVYRSICKKA